MTLIFWKASSSCVTLKGIELLYGDVKKKNKLKERAFGQTSPDSTFSLRGTNEFELGASASKAAGQAC